MERYETEDDLNHEQMMLSFLFENWRFDPQTGLARFDYGEKIPERYAVDYALMRSDGSIWGFVEMKYRKSLKFGFGNGYYLSLSKVMRARQIYSETGRPSYLMVRLADPLFAIVGMGKHKPGCVYAGRTDLPEGKEPSLVYPWDAFEIIEDHPGESDG